MSTTCPSSPSCGFYHSTWTSLQWQSRVVLHWAVTKNYAAESSSSCSPAPPGRVAVAPKDTVPVVGGAVCSNEPLLWRPRSSCLLLWHYQVVFRVMRALSNKLFFCWWWLFSTGNFSRLFFLFLPIFLKCLFAHNGMVHICITANFRW